MPSTSVRSSAVSVSLHSFDSSISYLPPTGALHHKNKCASKHPQSYQQTVNFINKKASNRTIYGTDHTTTESTSLSSRNARDDLTKTSESSRPSSSVTSRSQASCQSETAVVFVVIGAVFAIAFALSPTKITCEIDSCKSSQGNNCKTGSDPE